MQEEIFQSIKDSQAPNSLQKPVWELGS